MANHYLRKTKKTASELLWEQFRKGDMLSFRKIYESNYQHLYNFGLKYLTPLEVEDCIQNLFLYILQHRKSLIRVKNIEAYLFISFRNRITKTGNIKQHIFTNVDNTIAAETTNTSKESLFSGLRTLLQRLSPRENEIIHLKYYQNFNNIEIAESLGIEYQTVRNILNKAMKKLRKTSFQASFE